MNDLALPPSITVGPTSLGVSVLTGAGETVMINLPRPRGLHGLSQEELAIRALRLAHEALRKAVEQLEGPKAAG